MVPRRELRALSFAVAGCMLLSCSPSPGGPRHFARCSKIDAAFLSTYEVWRTSETIGSYRDTWFVLRCGQSCESLIPRNAQLVPAGWIWEFTHGPPPWATVYLAAASEKKWYLAEPTPDPNWEPAWFTTYAIDNGALAVMCHEITSY